MPQGRPTVAGSVRSAPREGSASPRQIAGTSISSLATILGVGAIGGLVADRWSSAPSTLVVALLVALAALVGLVVGWLAAVVLRRADRGFDEGGRQEAAVQLRLLANDLGEPGLLDAVGRVEKHRLGLVLELLLPWPALAAMVVRSWESDDLDRRERRKLLLVVADVIAPEGMRSPERCTCADRNVGTVLETVSGTASGAASAQEPGGR